MSERAEKARSLFLQGYNCSQAIAVAFCDVTGINADTAARLVSGFGGGMSRMREVCGAASGIVFVMSALYGYEQPTDFDGKKALYAEVQKVLRQFETQNGSLVCRELLGLSGKGADSPVPEQRTPAYYKKRPCPDIIYTAAEILDSYIKERQSQ